MFRRITALLLAATLTLALPVFARQYEQGSLVIGHPWSRPTAPGMSMGVAYLSITNRGESADTLIGASSPAAAKIELHQTSFADGMARMRPLSEVGIPPGATVQIEPGGIHLMLVDLVSALERGTSVPLVLEFRRAGKVTVQLSIEARDAP